MKIGVIGAGTMGSGIAQVFAAGGNDVLLCDISREFADGGKEKIRKQLEKRIGKGKLQQEEADALLSRIVTGLKEECTDCDLIIEAAVENEQIKKQTFRELDGIAREGCIFCTNTSSISVTRISEGLSRPVTGMHFFNPAPVMKLVEVVQGEQTDDALAAEISAIAEGIGKTPVIVKDAPGFVVNRVLIPMINEAIGIYASGTADVSGIDTAMKLGASHPMGPLELADMIGLDVVLAILEVIEKETGDKKYAPHPLLVKMVQEGKLGRKSGSGFTIG